MAVTAGTRSFWSALLSVLLKCIAALRSLPVARTAAPAAAPAPAAPASAVRQPAAAPVTGPGAAFGVGHVPEPRARLPYVPCIPQQSRRGARTLPPTMKQRISAEAHGSSPSVRSLSGDALLADGRYAGSVTIAPPSATPACAAATASASASAAADAGTAAPASAASSAAARVREPAAPRA